MEEVHKLGFLSFQNIVLQIERVKTLEVVLRISRTGFVFTLIRIYFFCSRCYRFELFDLSLAGVNILHFPLVKM